MEHCDSTSHDFAVAGSISSEDGKPYVLLNSKTWLLAMTPLQAYDLAAELMREAKKIEIQMRMFEAMVEPDMDQEARDALLIKVHDLTCDCDEASPPEFNMDVHHHAQDKKLRPGGLN